MKCKEIHEVLEQYLDNELSPEARKEVREHLKGCPACREELASVKRYRKAMASLKTVPAPDDFLESVHRRLDRSPLRRLLDFLFSPVHIKVPLEAAGVLATVIIVLLLFPGAPKRDTFLAMREEETSRMPAEEIAPKAPDAEKRSLLTEDSKRHMPSRSKGKEKVAAEEPEQYIIALQITPASMKTPPMAGMDKTSRLLGSAMKKAEVRDDKDITADVEEKDALKEDESSSRKAVVRARSESPRELTDTVQEIKRIAGSLEGRVIREKYNKQNVPDGIILEIPTRNYVDFMNQLNRIGKPEIQKKPTRRAKRSTQLRIDLVQ
jgi:hypothetical protein